MTHAHALRPWRPCLPRRAPLRRFAGLLVALPILTGGVPAARAQQLVLHAMAEGSSGVEGGARDEAAGVRRARTTVRAGAEGWVDEFPSDALAVALLVEVEPSAAVGADVRYVRKVGGRLGLWAGAVGFVAPESMLGAEVGATYEIPLSKKNTFAVGPTVPVYFLGSDLPTGTVLWQALLQAGFRVGL